MLKATCALSHSTRCYASQFSRPGSTSSRLPPHGRPRSARVYQHRHGRSDSRVCWGLAEVLEGKGPAASDGDMVEFNYVCRRSNGYFVYSTVDQFSGESRPVTLPLNGRKMIAGLQKVLVGMKPGGKRRAIIPPAVGYIDAGLEPQPKEFGPQRSLLSHAKEPLLFEVQLLKIRY